jgi:hydrogenase maturation protease
LARSAVNIVGVGSLVMGDDGVGPAVIERLRLRGAPECVRLFDAGLAFSDVIATLDPDEPLIVIDAVKAGGAPGSLYRLALDPGHVAGDLAADGAMLSLHELSVLPTLRLEALCGRVFADVTVFGVEPAEVAWGDRLSPAVAGAVDRLVEAVLDHVKARGDGTLVGDGRI